MDQPLDANVTATIDKFIVASPFGATVGIRCESIAEDHVRLRLPFRSEVTTVGDMVHGGAIGALVDVSATAAAWATPSATLQARGSTVGFSLSFLAPGRARDLFADARIVQRGKSLCVCEVDVTDTEETLVARALVTYRLALPSGAGAKLAAVRAYGDAKNRRDAATALALCHADYVLETVPFGSASRDRDATARQLAHFFAAFPDYRCDTEGAAEQGEQVVWWGRMVVRFQGAFLGIAPTGRTASVPAHSIYDFRDGRLLRERFHFDLAAFCDGIGVPVERFQAALREARG
jgi:steroid delta-isomerase-like uncharacterized protein